jgi:protein SCO1/2
MKIMSRSTLIVIVGAFLCTSGYGQLSQPTATPIDMSERVGIDQKLNAQVPLDLKFTEASGKEVMLRDYFGEKPVILTLVYYECPMLCTLILNGTLRALRTLEFNAGQEYEVLTVSINPRETPELASSKKQEYLSRYQREGAENGWHFMVGDEDPIKSLADSVGFRYEYDEASGQYAHASGIMILTPEGKVARYFYGVEYSPRDIRLGLVEAAEEKIGTPTDQVLLLCFHYDPLTGKYSFTVMTILRIAGAFTILGIVVLLAFLLRRDPNRKVRAHAHV